VTHLPDLSKAPALASVAPLLEGKNLSGSDLMWDVDVVQWQEDQRRRRHRGIYFQRVWSQKNIPSSKFDFSGDWTPENYSTYEVRNETGWFGTYWRPRNHGGIPKNIRSEHVVANSTTVWIGNPSSEKDCAYYLSPNLRKQTINRYKGPLFPPHNATSRYLISPRPPGNPLQVENLNVGGEGDELTTSPPDYERIGDIVLNFRSISPPTFPCLRSSLGDRLLSLALP